MTVIVSWFVNGWHSWIALAALSIVVVVLFYLGAILVDAGCRRNPNEVPARGPIARYIRSRAVNKAWWVRRDHLAIGLVAIVIGAWGIALSVATGDASNFPRSGALITLLAVVYGFLALSYESGLRNRLLVVKSSELSDADREGVQKEVTTLSRLWITPIIIAGTLIWAYGDLFSNSMIDYACRNKWAMFIHCASTVHCVSTVSTPQRFLVLFPWNSATLGPSAEEVIWKVHQEAANDSKAAVRLVGHADETGSPAYNLALSERRANAVSEELRKLGLSPNQIIVTFEGSHGVLVSGGRKAREPLNRNVQVTVDR